MSLAGWRPRKCGHDRPAGGGGRFASASWAGLVAGLALLGLAAAVVISTVPRPIDAGRAPQGRDPALRRPAAGPADPPRAGRSALGWPAAAALSDPETGPPQRLVAPAVRIDARVVPVHVAKGGSLEVPGNPRVLGWWAKGAIPGSPVGTAVIDGHVDSAVAGIGALFRLRYLRPGAWLRIVGPQGSLSYTVVGVREYPKSSLPREQLFTQHVAGRLVIITCGGPFDRAAGSYRDNIVAFAVPALGGPEHFAGR